MSAELDTLVREHRDAVAHFVARAGLVGADRWLTPRAEGKWTPAEETRHVILTYEAIVADLRDERRMASRGGGLRRLVWRAFGLTSILWLRRIPRPVPAPREVRPAEERGSRDELLATLARAVADFEDVFASTWRDRPRKVLAHPYFGNITLRQAMTLMTVHTRHHAAFLPPAGPV